MSRATSSCEPIQHCPPRYDDTGKRVVVSWCKREELRQLIADGKDWPTKTPEDKREDLLNRFDKLTALHGDN